MDARTTHRAHAAKPGTPPWLDLVRRADWPVCAPLGVLTYLPAMLALVRVTCAVFVAYVRRLLPRAWSSRRRTPAGHAAPEQAAPGGIRLSRGQTGQARLGFP